MLIYTCIILQLHEVTLAGLNNPFIFTAINAQDRATTVPYHRSDLAYTPTSYCSQLRLNVVADNVHACKQFFAVLNVSWVQATPYTALKPRLSTQVKFTAVETLAGMFSHMMSTADNAMLKQKVRIDVYATPHATEDS